MSADYVSYSDQFLVHQLKDNDQEAFRELYKRYSPKVFKTAYTILRDRAAAEDAMQEVFLNLWRSRNTLEIQSPGAYLNQSAWHKALYIQKEQKKDHAFYDRLSAISAVIAKEDPVLSKEFAAILGKAIAGLPADELEILTYSREHNMTHAEIARHLNIHQKKVERKISLSLKKIKVQLGNWLLLLLLFLLLHL